MTKRLQVYRCNVCGNIVEVLYAGVGELVCCGQPMEMLEEKTDEVGKEKHVPVIEKTQSGVKIKVSSVPHPMEKEHHIGWIEVIADGKAYRQFLTSKDSPEATFVIKADNIIARECCTLHGLWRSKG
ncbi:MAG: desulfoferrodoxin [Methanocellales archaeon]|nr:desulfoferrodoxin [Methanocellales archaeon]